MRYIEYTRNSKCLLSEYFKDNLVNVWLSKNKPTSKIHPKFPLYYMLIDIDDTFVAIFIDEVPPNEVYYFHSYDETDPTLSNSVYYFSNDKNELKNIAMTFKLTFDNYTVKVDAK